MCFFPSTIIRSYFQLDNVQLLPNRANKHFQCGLSYDRNKSNYLLTKHNTAKVKEYIAVQIFFQAQITGFPLC